MGFYSQVNEDQFRVDCNCSGTWAPSPVPTTQGGTPIQSGNESTPPTPAPAKESFCGATDPFSITSEQLQDLEGCYSDTGGLLSRSFSQTDELTVGEVAVYMGYVDLEDEDVSEHGKRVGPALPAYNPISSSSRLGPLAHQHLSCYATVPHQSEGQ